MRTISPTTKTAVLLATAKQIPCAPLIMAVLMPTTSPFVATSGPPELPGLSAASVWMTSSIRRPLRARRLRPSAETTPAVTVDFEPEGIADRDDELAAPQGLRIAEPGGGRPAGRFGAQESQIGVGIVTEHLRLGLAALREGEARALRSAHDMAVGQDETVTGNDDAGTDATAVASPSGALNPNDRRPDPVDHGRDRPRIGVERCFLGGMGDRVLGRQSVCGVEHDNTSEMDDAEPCCVRDGVGAADRVKLVDQRADVELGRVDGDAEPAGDHLVRRSLGEQRQHLQFARRQGDLDIRLWRDIRRGDRPGGSTTAASAASPAPTSRKPGTPARSAASRSASAGSATSSASRRGPDAACSLKRRASRRW